MKAATGLIGRLDAMLAAAVSRAGRETFPNRLPDPVVWLATAVLAFGLAFAIVVDHAVHHLPVTAIALGHDPSAEVPAIKKRDESIRWGVVGGAGDREKENPAEGGE